MENKKKINQLVKGLGNKVKLNEPLGRHTTFKIGGPTDLLLEVDTQEELIRAIKLSRKLEVPFLILGGGSNVLISDEGFRGMVVKNQVSGIKFQNERVIAGSGTPLGELVEEAANHSLSGLEFGFGIPGTIGGAVVGNAGVSDKAIGDLVERVKVLDEKGEEVNFAKDQCQFDYRQSRFQKESKVILEVVLRLKKDNKKEIRERMQQYLDRRKDQPKEPSAGSIFKNPSEKSAGELIEQVGLKGETIGQAQISEEHANWIINLGGARCQDVLELLSLAKSKVRARFGIELEEEIQIIDEV